MNATQWFRNSPAYDYFNGFRYQFEWVLWIANRLNRAPHILKRRIIKRKAQEHNARMFVETGTLFGDMTYSQRNHFKRLFSIELDSYLFHRACRRLKRFPHITLLHGDSGQKIAEVLKEVTEPCVFWLDAHFSGGITAHGEQATPIHKEIVAILKHDIKDHVILIDDARDFNGSGGYPSSKELRLFVENLDQHYSVWLESDILIISR